MEVLNPTTHFDQYGSGVRRGDSNVESDESNESVENEYMPTIRMEIRRYNKVLSNWLHRAFSAILQISASRLSIRPNDKVGISFTRGNNDAFHFSFRQFRQYTPCVLHGFSYHVSFFTHSSKQQGVFV